MKKRARLIGRTELFGGRQEKALNVREPEILREPRAQFSSKLFIRKWPGIVSNALDASYWFRTPLEVPLSYYHMKSRVQDTVLVASTSKSLTEMLRIENALNDSVRGHAVQIILEGRGVKAYLDPSWPNLKVKLSVGSVPLDFTHILSKDRNVKGFVDSKLGNQVVIWGPTKERVGKMVMRIYRETRARPLTGKGSHIANNPPQLIKKKQKSK